VNRHVIKSVKSLKCWLITKEVREVVTFLLYFQVMRTFFVFVHLSATRDSKIDTYNFHIFT
jgi:hypothetical protein